MQCHVISLQTEAKRRAHMLTEFTKHGIQFDFHDAITPSAATALASELHLQVDKTQLTDVELACFMSHVELWTSMQDNNIPYMAIFEDDVYLGSDAHFYLTQSTWLHPDWHIIDLEYFDRRVIVGQDAVTLPTGNRKLLPLRSPNLGTAGYILSKEGATSLLAYIQERVLTPLDHMMFKRYIDNGRLPIHYMSPSLVIQDMKRGPTQAPNLSSTLIHDRQQRMKTQRVTGIAKVRKELSRIYAQIRHVLIAKKAFFQ